MIYSKIQNLIKEKLYGHEVIYITESFENTQSMFVSFKDYCLENDDKDLEYFYKNDTRFITSGGMYTFMIFVHKKDNEYKLVYCNGDGTVTIPSTRKEIENRIIQ